MPREEKGPRTHRLRSPLLDCDRQSLMPGGESRCLAPGNPPATVLTSAPSKASKGFSEPPPPAGLTLPSHSEKVQGELPRALPASALTCVSAEMSLEVRTFEVGFPAAWKVANVVPPSEKVYLRGTAMTGGDEHRGRGEGQQPGIASGHDARWGAGRGLGECPLGQNQHHGSWGHRWSQEHRLGPCSSVGRDGCNSPGRDSGRRLQKRW